MELTLFIDRILTENNKPCSANDVKKVEKYIIQKAQKEAGNNRSIGIDDETVKKWILEYSPDKETVKENNEEVIEEKKEENKPSFIYKPIDRRPKKIKKDESKFSWGEQESLF